MGMCTISPSGLTVSSSLQLGNPAGVAWNLAEGLSERGCRSTVVELESGTEQFQAHVRLHIAPSTPFPLRLLRFTKIARLAQRSDIVHFHFGIRPFGRYLRRLCAAPFVVHFHGSDLRDGISDGYRDLASPEFVSTPDLKRWAPRATWIPNPCRLPELAPRIASDRLVVGHFPSDLAKKGTSRIVEGIRRVQTEVDFDFQLCSGVSHEDALRIMRGCDVVVDQLSGYGVYGMVAVEGMAFGRVVLSSIDPSYYEGCPVVPVSEENFDKRLLEILADPERRRLIGDEGRTYVRMVHDPRRVAEIVLGQYARIG